jgi:mRNA interferase MazF
MEMKEGDIVLVPLAQADGILKNRPVLLLKKFQPFDDFLVCGISTQLKQEVSGFDFVIESDKAYFKQTGLLQTSLIRLGFLAMVPTNKMKGKIGSVDVELRKQLLIRLSSYLLQ